MLDSGCGFGLSRSQQFHGLERRIIQRGLNHDGFAERTVGAGGAEIKTATRHGADRDGCHAGGNRRAGRRPGNANAAAGSFVRYLFGGLFLFLLFHLGKFFLIDNRAGVHRAVLINHSDLITLPFNLETGQHRCGHGGFARGRIAHAREVLAHGALVIEISALVVGGKCRHAGLWLIRP